MVFRVRNAQNPYGFIINRVRNAPNLYGFILNILIGRNAKYCVSTDVLMSGISRQGLYREQEVKTC